MSERIELIDAWRGLACWLMLGYHLAFDLYAFGWMSGAVFSCFAMDALERVIAWSFILCAGISCRFSHSNFKRGILCAAAGAVVVAASYVVDSPIRFGVLQLLSVSMLLYAAFGQWIDTLPCKIAPFLYLLLYFATKYRTESFRVQARWLYWLGLRYEGFVSYDYFPLLPYLFLFLLGTWLGQWVQRHREARIFTAPMPSALTWPGRHTMIIYLAHQPVLYGLCGGIHYFLSR